jgi:predicted acyl esterase
MGGYQQLLRAEVMRGKFRDALDQPKPFTPNEPTRVAFRLNDVYHTFRAGHRLMVHIQSTWFPLVDRNPQQFLDINSAQENDFRKAVHRVFRTPDQPSRLLLPILAAMPPSPDAH